MAPTDYESKEHVCGEPQSQAGQGSLIAHTVRKFADLRQFGQNIPQQICAEGLVIVHINLATEQFTFRTIVFERQYPGTRAKQRVKLFWRI